MNVTPILRAVRKEITQLQAVEVAVSNLGRKGPNGRHLSVAARKRIAEAQRARWAKWKKKNNKAA